MNVGFRPASNLRFGEIFKYDNAKDATKKAEELASQGTAAITYPIEGSNDRFVATKGDIDVVKKTRDNYCTYPAVK